MDLRLIIGKSGAGVDHCIGCDFGILMQIFDNMHHGNVPINYFLVKLSKFPPLPKIAPNVNVRPGIFTGFTGFCWACSSLNMIHNIALDGFSWLIRPSLVRRKNSKVEMHQPLTCPLCRRNGEGPVLPQRACSPRRTRAIHFRPAYVGRHSRSDRGPVGPGFTSQIRNLNSLLTGF